MLQGDALINCRAKMLRDAAVTASPAALSGSEGGSEHLWPLVAIGVPDNNVGSRGIRRDATWSEVRSLPRASNSA